jgi:hypothetical protein
MYLTKTAITEKETAFYVSVAGEAHLCYAEEIAAEMASSAQARGTGIARRSPESIREKMRSGKAVIALAEDNTWAGFAYLEAWENGAFVSNSGLIIAPRFRRQGLAGAIKKEIFRLSRSKYPQSKIFGLTTSQAVMKINSKLRFEPVIYSEITSDDSFWEGCRSCVNYPILQSKQRRNCLCTAMLFDPENQNNEE